MSKRLYTYAGFTAQDLKNRASIPSQGDITVGSNYIDCSSVDIPSEIRDVIGEGSNDLGTIYCSAKVNKWSGFGPREWYVSGASILNRVISNPYDMANFCGYNHNAIAPYASPVFNTSQVIGTNLNITPELHLGEINWQILSLTDITGVVAKVYHDEVLIAQQSAAFDDPTRFDKNAFYFDMSFANTYTDLTVKYQFVRMTESGFAAMYQIPNIVDTPVNIERTDGGTTSYPPIISDIQLGLDIYNEYPNAYLVYGNAGTSTVTGTTFNFSIKGIDTDSDGLGDITGITFPVYVSKNGAAKVYAGDIRPARANTVGFSSTITGNFVQHDTLLITIGD